MNVTQAVEPITQLENRAGASVIETLLMCNLLPHCDSPTALSVTSVL